MTKTFRDLGVDEQICAALEVAGITTPFPIQSLALPIGLSGHDIIGQARTGTGKTSPRVRHPATAARGGGASYPAFRARVPGRGTDPL